MIRFCRITTKPVLFPYKAPSTHPLEKNTPPNRFLPVDGVFFSYWNDLRTGVHSTSSNLYSVLGKLKRPTCPQKLPNSIKTLFFLYYNSLKYFTSFPAQSFCEFICEFKTSCEFIVRLVHNNACRCDIISSTERRAAQWLIPLFSFVLTT